MNAEVSQITLVVKSQTEALDFTQKLGFKKRTDYTPPGGYRWVAVGPKSQDLEFALYQADFTNTYSMMWQPGVSPSIVLRVDDCYEVFTELKSRGVPFKQDHPEEYPWGISATFSDPDGNLFSINQLPSK